VQAAVEVAAEDAARLSELSKQLSKETAELAKLRASCDGLQKKATALQVCQQRECIQT
jgi:cell division protein FtsB